MSLTLPRFEMFEEGAQVRRSAKSVAAQIVEGYSLRRHKNEFLLYLQRAYASAVETTEHLELLRETKSLADDALYADLSARYHVLCGLIYRFIEGVRTHHGALPDSPVHAAPGTGGSR
jgi:four helix bundle protein